ncbi:hypothetical protein H6F42_05350 [Pseudanabaena sp. FACHB-1998]|uniref:hypothetical protein n=1 Tax=Pseudanabaena sp. FACHB-1998 TaxID=2692858 RepID=UPI00168029D7|nr:hypothetical protein [Pseudanabaena sp. FACHB-1998]MBD2176344.1 hypothetical protein [Pseudanabaena sp. FACHB-1998]
MLVEHPNRQELTAEELLSLKNLQSVIRLASADGKISKYDLDLIDRTIHADGKVLVEEVNMVRQLIHDKLANGWLSYDWNN